MTSWQMRVSHWVMRPTRWMQGLMANRLTPKQFARFRDWSDNLAQSPRLPPDVRQQVIDCDGVTCYLFRSAVLSQSTDPTSLIIFFHGSGFCFGWNAYFQQMAIRLTRLTGIPLLAVQYRLAPEYTYPAAHDDALTVYQWALNNSYSPDKMTVLGDSAGAQLALTLMFRLRETGRPLPHKLALLSAIVDFTSENTAYLHSNDPFAHPAWSDYLCQMYISQHDVYDPFISPVLADLNGLPATFIAAGERDFLREQNERLAELARHAGVDVTFWLADSAWHGWYMFAQYLPEARKTLEEMASFIIRPPEM